MICKVKSYILKFLITWNFFYLLWVATLIEVHVHVIFCLYEKLEKNINCVRTKTARAKLGVKTEALGLRKKNSVSLSSSSTLTYNIMICWRLNERLPIFSIWRNNTGRIVICIWILVCRKIRVVRGCSGVVWGGRRPVHVTSFFSVVTTLTTISVFVVSVFPIFLSWAHYQSWE